MFNAHADQELLFLHVNKPHCLTVQGWWAFLQSSWIMWPGALIPCKHVIHIHIPSFCNLIRSRQLPTLSSPWSGSSGFLPWVPGQWIRYRSKYWQSKLDRDRWKAAEQVPSPWSFGPSNIQYQMPQHCWIWLHHKPVIKYFLNKWNESSIHQISPQNQQQVWYKPY